MRKPKYMESLLGMICLCICIAFLLMGVFGLAGILKPDRDSQVQAPIVMGYIFMALGVVFSLAGNVCMLIARRKEQLCGELLANGRKCDGIVERIQLQTAMRYNRRSPYVIFYTYHDLGQQYHHKSYLIWEQPACKVNDFIQVYANDRGQSTVSGIES